MPEWTNRDERCPNPREIDQIQGLRYQIRDNLKRKSADLQLHFVDKVSGSRWVPLDGEGGVLFLLQQQHVSEIFNRFIDEMRLSQIILNSPEYSINVQF